MQNQCLHVTILLLNVPVYFGMGLNSQDILEDTWAGRTVGDQTFEVPPCAFFHR